MGLSEIENRIPSAITLVTLYTGNKIIIKTNGNILYLTACSYTLSVAS